MPKSTADAALLIEVNVFVDQCPTRSAAAEKLGVHRSTLWRFMKKEGRALTKTRKRFRMELGDRTKSATPVVAVQLNATPAGDDEVAELRRFCNSLRALLDERDRRTNTAVGQQAEAPGA